MTAIRGVFGAVDELGAAYRNDIEDVRAAVYHALGGTQGILDGFVLSTVAGVMEVDLTAGRALIAERGVDITAEDRGYFVFADDVTTVTFDGASVADRCDALVFAWPDPQYGALGASVTTAGPQIVVVKGVSGSTTPRTDSEINTAIGVGGWFRYADVVIDSTDTEINPANVTLADTSVVDPWHVVGSGGGEPSYSTVYSAGPAGTQAARFRKDADGIVIMNGYVDATDLVNGNGAVAFTLPADYRPTADIHHFFTMWNAASATPTYISVTVAGPTNATFSHGDVVIGWHTDPDFGWMPLEFTYSTA